MKKLLKSLVVASAVAMAPVAAHAEGNLVAPPATVLELDIIGNTPALSQDTFELETGVYYRLVLNSDGVGEFMFSSPDLMPNIHVRLIVINDIEVHMQGQTFRGIEFDGAGEAAISFLIVRPGEYAFTVGPATGTFIVR